MEKVLVIGGNGFIGSNIVNYLNNKNVFSATYDIKKGNTGKENYEGNIVDDISFDSIISQHDVIIYLITTVSPKKSMDDPESAYKNDVPLLIKTLESCVKSGVKRVIFSSSGGTIYGETIGHNAKEDDQKFPINNYAICKLTCEYILEMYNKLYNMENISLRISNPYGNGQRPESGVGVITTFIDKVCKNEIITLFGDGSITRDFINVDKVAEAFYLATKWKFDNDVTPIFNIGSGQGISLKEIVDLISVTLNIVPNINFLPEREFDVKSNVLDVSKSEKYLDYKPISNEKEDIKKYILTMAKKYTNK